LLLSNDNDRVNAYARIQLASDPQA
jgi:hypothetical protein